MNAKHFLLTLLPVLILGFAAQAQAKVAIQVCENIMARDASSSKDSESAPKKLVPFKNSGITIYDDNTADLKISGAIETRQVEGGDLKKPTKEDPKNMIDKNIAAEGFQRLGLNVPADQMATAITWILKDPGADARGFANEGDTVAYTEVKMTSGEIKILLNLGFAPAICKGGPVVNPPTQP